MVGAAAEERRALKAQAYAAYRATHVGYLGAGVYWTDEEGEADRLDIAHREERGRTRRLSRVEQGDVPIPLPHALGAEGREHQARHPLPRGDREKGRESPLSAPRERGLGGERRRRAVTEPDAAVRDEWSSPLPEERAQ